jgi:hypothetical protein
MQSGSLPAATALASGNNWPEETVTARPVLFLREHWLSVSLVSVALMVPCFWHTHLVAGDLGSHIYNAWLAQLIKQGQAPGLWIADQWNNVLFDNLLSGLANIFSLSVAAKIAASLSTLVFFWGVFTFIWAMTHRCPWFLSPLIAMFAYGWTFQAGFFNYYLSLGLGFLGLSIFMNSRGWQRLAVIAVSPVIVVAHPLGLAWFLGGAIYIAIAQHLPPKFHLLMVLASAGVLVFAHQFLWHHYRVEPRAHSVLFYSGLDQLLLANRYVAPTAALGFFFAVSIGIDVLSRRKDKDFSALYAIPLGLYLVAETAVHLLPDTVFWPQYPAPASLLTSRFTLISAVLLCCLLGAVKPTKWHAAVLAAIAGVFFLFLYEDTQTLNQIEEQAAQLVRSLPAGQRVLATIGAPLSYRFSTKHIVDEACAGYCYFYGNYEASSGHFRIRARPENPIVMSRDADVLKMEVGSYVTRANDLPAAQVYQCGPRWMDLCIHPLQAGERNDRLGFHPERGIYPNSDAR